MASTKNKNTAGNYFVESSRYSKMRNYYTSTDSIVPYKMAGNGLIASGSTYPRDALSYNPVEIESFLFGIGSTNLTKEEPYNDLRPQLKSICFQDIINRNSRVILPHPFYPEQDQRPLKS